MTNDSPIWYGIWIPRKGWVRGEGNKALMFDYHVIASETAKRLGNHTKVYFIDQSLVDIEHLLLEAERTEFFYPWFQFELMRLKKFFIKDRQ